MCLQVILFTVCYIDLDCERIWLEYYDGDIRQTPHRYCGLRQMMLPISNSSVVIMDTTGDSTRYVSEMKIHYRSVDKDGPETGKIDVFCLLFLRDIIYYIQFRNDSYNMRLSRSSVIIWEY